MESSSFENITNIYLDSIEDELHQAMQRANDFGNSRLYEMLAYHMGWQNNTSKNESRGKRIRPLLVLLTCSAAGGEWKHALPGASAVELVHNFSLIHDDIEDGSLLRRGRPTVWKRWGVPQAINTGDAMFALAHLEVLRLAETVSPAIAMQAAQLLQYTCLHLTQGQFLDLSYEQRNDLSIEEYWRMVEGKTAALVATSTQLGAMSAFVDDKTIDLYRKFGHSLGMAFQVRDDFLGIWGNSNLTGKSSQSDLVTRKKTLPVVFGLTRDGHFAERWKKGTIRPDETAGIIALLEAEGGKEFIESQAQYYIGEALSTLEEAHPSGLAGEALKNLAKSLVTRQT